MGTIYNIQRFSLHDGPGIRTTVFLKGCPLKCRWCHNPESQRLRPQLSLVEEQCMGCGSCLAACEVHVLEEGRHRIDFGACRACGRCAQLCPAGALEILGREASAEEVLQEAVRDSAFYASSGGGITISGGEPTMQPEFALEILSGAQNKGIHTAMETCGYAKWAVFQRLLPHLNMVLYDVKQMDGALHRAYTGVDNGLILENLKKLCAKEQRVEVVVRMPVIPGYSDQREHFRALSRFLTGMERVPRVEVLPYNPLAESKYPRLGMAYQPGRLDETDGNSPEALCSLLEEAGIEARVVR